MRKGELIWQHLKKLWNRQKTLIGAQSGIFGIMIMMTGSCGSGRMNTAIAVGKCGVKNREWFEADRIAWMVADEIYDNHPLTEEMAEEITGEKLD